MLRNLYCCTLFVLVIGCTAISQPKNVTLIVYTDFIDPQKTYDTLINNFTQSGLVDSLKITGRPIFINTLRFDIDTLKVNHFGISIADVQDKISKTTKSHANRELMEEFIKTDGNENIPISSLVKVYSISDYYKPELFLPEPNVYYYNDKRCVKVQFYCQPRSKKRLTKFINSYLSNYSGSYAEESITWEFLK